MTSPRRGPGSGAGPRRRPAPLRARVLGTTALSPNLVRVTIGGEALANFTFPGPASHFKLFLPLPGDDDVHIPEPDADGLITPDRTTPRIMRTYTARRFDPATGALDIDLVLHGDGPAAQWAANATPGDRLALSSPRSAGFTAPADATWLLLGGDTSALPAIATILESAPDTAVTCFVEITDEGQRIDLPANPRYQVIWTVRTPTDAPGSALLHRLQEFQIPAAPGFVWLAGETGGIRRCRQHLLSERGFDHDRMVTRDTGESEPPITPTTTSSTNPPTDRDPGDRTGRQPEPHTRIRSRPPERRDAARGGYHEPRALRCPASPVEHLAEHIA